MNRATDTWFRDSAKVVEILDVSSSTLRNPVSNTNSWISVGNYTYVDDKAYSGARTNEQTVNLFCKSFLLFRFGYIWCFGFR